jgi:hypothetical protein
MWRHRRRFNELIVKYSILDVNFSHDHDSSVISKHRE